MGAATEGDALGYAARGWPVFPVAPGGKRPLTRHGCRDATTDPEQVKRWWDEHPDANVGIATGPPGPTVVDCDGPIGRHNWLKLVAGHGWRTPWACTGGGGWHVYFVGHPDVRNTAGRIPKLDVRGVGGYVVAPPSTHASGAHYWWVAGPDVFELEPLPEHVRVALAGPVPVERRPLTIATRSRMRVARTLSSGYGKAALTGEADQVRHAVAGTRNETLVRAAFRVGQLVATGTVDEQEAHDTLTAAAADAGLPWREIARTIYSGINAGKATPR